MSDMGISSARNRLRITGMASGLDVDATVEKMSLAYKMKLDRAQQNKQSIAWRQEEYRGIIKGMKEFQDYFKAGSPKNIFSVDKWRPYSTSVDKENVVKATAVEGASSGNYKIKVEQLAESAVVSGESIAAMVQVKDTSISNWQGGSIKFSIDGTNEISINIPSCITDKTNIAYDQSKVDSFVSDAVKSINEQIFKSDKLSGKISASYIVQNGVKSIKFNDLTSKGEVKLVSTTVISELDKLKYNPGPPEKNPLIRVGKDTKLTELGAVIDSSLSLTYKGGTVPAIKIQANTTIESLISEVNTKTGGKVVASFDESTGKFSFKSRETGSDAGVSLSGTNADLLKALGFKDMAQSAIGKDALVTITSPNSTTSTTMTQKSNDFTVDGMNYNITNVSKPGEEAIITVKSDNNKVTDNLKKFVDDYNALVTTIEKKLTEKPNRSFKPLTDEQKKSMSKEEIEKWEEKGKVGVLRNDDLLQGLLSNLKSIFNTPVSKSFTKATEGKQGNSEGLGVFFGKYGSNPIGLDFMSKSGERSKLEIDMTKFTTALNNNPEAVKNFFVGKSTKSIGKDDTYMDSEVYHEDGVFNRMSNIFQQNVGIASLGTDGTGTLGLMSSFVNKQFDFSTTGSGGKNTLPDQIYKKQIAVNMATKKYEDMQSKYYMQFSHLEKAMNAMNSQSSWLSSQLGGN